MISHDILSAPSALLRAGAKGLAVVRLVRHPERSEGSSANGDSISRRCLAALDMTGWTDGSAPPRPS